MPSYVVQVSQYRRRHLEDLKRMIDPNDFKEFATFASRADDEEISIPDSGSKIPAAVRSPTGAIKATSYENIVPLAGAEKSPGIFRKLRFSKEIGKRIRDDLMRKLNKQKQRIITKIDLEREKGRPLTKNERNFMIFHWLQSVDEDSFDEP